MTRQDLINQMVEELAVCSCMEHSYEHTAKNILAIIKGSREHLDYNKSKHQYEWEEKGVNMSTNADFYILDEDSIKWLGSLYRGGDPENIPTDILIQVSRVMFEEMLFDHLESNDGVTDEWPWMWSDSRATDYSYFYHTEQGKILMSVSGSRLVDPIKILQGMDMIGADVGIGLIKFPVILPSSLNKTEELIKLYGPKFTATL